MPYPRFLFPSQAESLVPRKVHHPPFILISHLQLYQTYGCARAWIDTSFFRASAMVPDGKQMILEIEFSVLSTTILPRTFTTISGRADYTAIVAQSEIAGESILLGVTKRLIPFAVLRANIGCCFDPQKSSEIRSLRFFVVEGKLGALADHVPQAVAEIYTCAKYLKYAVYLICILFFDP